MLKGNFCLSLPSCWGLYTPHPQWQLYSFCLWVLGDLEKCSTLVHEEQTSAHRAFPSQETVTQQLVVWLFMSFRLVTLDRTPSLCVMLDIWSRETGPRASAASQAPSCMLLCPGTVDDAYRFPVQEAHLTYGPLLSQDPIRGDHSQSPGWGQGQPTLQ